MTLSTLQRILSFFREKEGSSRKNWVKYASSTASFTVAVILEESPSSSRFLDEEVQMSDHFWLKSRPQFSVCYQSSAFSLGHIKLTEGDQPVLRFASHFEDKTFQVSGIVTKDLPSGNQAPVLLVVKNFE